MTNDHDETSPIGEIDEWLQCAMAQHERGLVRYAQQFVGEVERARDVVQETFMKLHANRQSFQTADTSKLKVIDSTDSQLTSWLYKVCRNRAIDVARKEKRMTSSPPEQFDEQFATEQRSPDAVLLAEERNQTLLALIDRLPPNQQEVLRLKFHGGLSYQEIAEVTGHSRGNVGYLLHTAITKLRQRIDPTL